MRAPKTLQEFDEAMLKIEQTKRKSPNQLFPEVEHELQKQERFIKDQTKLIDEAVKSFRSLVCQLNILNSVAKVMGLESSKEITGDNELRISASQKSAKINESLINSEILDSSNICYLGGTIGAKEGLTLKRLLFRSTRGRALLTTFELNIAEEDVLRSDDFHKNQIGYVVLFEDFGQMRKIVERVCQSFVVGENKALFDVNPKTVAQDFKQITAQKCQLRDLIAHSKQTFFNYLNDFN